MERLISKTFSEYEIKLSKEIKEVDENKFGYIKKIKFNN